MVARAGFRHYLLPSRDKVASYPGKPVTRSRGRFTTATQATLLDSLHRRHVSRALGFPSFPCALLKREEAEEGFRYAPPAKLPKAPE